MNRLKLLAFTVAAGIAGAVLYVSVRFAGILDTIVYAMLFVVGATFVPVTILLFGPSFPQSLRKMFGKGNFILGQLAFGTGILVQHERKWQMHPARRTDDDMLQVHVDGEWHDIPNDEHLTILGWQPFGIVFWKDEDTLLEERIDFAAEVNREEHPAAADGGQTSIKRGGYEQVRPPTEETPDDTWIIDLKRVWSRGLQKYGDIGLIEKVEEITMRNEAKSGHIDGYEPIVGSIVGLIIGLITGYVMLFPS